MGVVIEFEIEDSVLADVDEVAGSIGISRETYLRVAIQHALRHHRPKLISAEDEANTFRLLLSDDAGRPDGYEMSDWPPDDGHLN